MVAIVLVFAGCVSDVKVVKGVGEGKQINTSYYSMGVSSLENWKCAVGLFGMTKRR